MMQTIGGQLEEARQRKGISLREAAEATKIRSDFLAYIEQNKMDFDLPDIYKRGFLKNYARYLKLDVEKLLTDYEAQLLGDTRKGKEGGVELFGQMEIKKTNGTDNNGREESDEPAPYGHVTTKPTRSNTSQEAEEEDADKTFYMKIGLIFVGTLALVFVVFGLIWAILGSDKSDAFTDSSETQEETIEAQSSEPSQTEDTGSESITLIASGNVYVLVKQQSDNQELMRKTMSEGESITLVKNGAVDILFTAGENLQIEHAGERLRPRGSGTAKISIK
jgi:cytoskeletal protein RodZ